MNLAEFVRQIEGALDDVPAGTLQPQSRFRELPQWSSLAALNIIALADAEYGLELSAEELRRSQTVEELFQILVAKEK